MGLEILRPWRSVEKISICPVHTGMSPDKIVLDDGIIVFLVRTGMNLDNIMLLERRRHLPRMHGDTHVLTGGEINRPD